VTDDLSGAPMKTGDPVVSDQRDLSTPLDPRRWLILGVLGLASLMVVLDSTIVNIALPSAQKALGFSAADRQWVVTAYSLAFGGLLLLGGRLSDLFGRKRTFLIGLTGFAAASAVGGLAQDFGMLIAARAVQGAFGALLSPSTLSLLATTFTDPGERRKAFGVYGAIVGGGGAIGLLLGGVLTEYLDWRWCLYVNVAIAFLAISGGMALLKNQTRSAGTHIDIPGTASAVVGLASLVFGFSEAASASHGWAAPQSYGALILAAVLLTSFVLIEQRVAHPLLPLRIVLHRNRGGSYLAVALVGITLFGLFLFLTYYLQTILGYSPVKSGLAFLPMVAGLVLASILSTAVLLPKTGPRILVVAGMLLGGGGVLILTQISLSTSYLTGIVPGLIITGLGVGTVFGTALNMATTGASQDDAGVASAMVSTGQQLGGSIGTALLNTIAISATTTFLRTHTPPTRLHELQASVHGDVTAFTVVVGIFIFAAVVTGIVFPSGRPAAATVHLGVLCAGRTGMAACQSSPGVTRRLLA
jgi:EmrB/QacA subfamily drug resistance transporter